MSQANNCTARTQGGEKEVCEIRFPSVAAEYTPAALINDLTDFRRLLSSSERFFSALKWPSFVVVWVQKMESYNAGMSGHRRDGGRKNYPLCGAKVALGKSQSLGEEAVIEKIIRRWRIVCLSYHVAWQLSFNLLGNWSEKVSEDEVNSWWSNWRSEIQCNLVMLIHSSLHEVNPRCVPIRDFCDIFEYWSSSKSLHRFFSNK